MTEPKFQIGDDVFTHNPSRYYKAARAIVGNVIAVIPIGSSFKYRLDTDKLAINTGPGITDFYWQKIRNPVIFEIDLGHRTGTPLSQVTGAMLDRMGREWRGENYD
jgi:hypothetical protein